MQRKFHFHVNDKATASVSANDADKGSIRAKTRTSVGSVFSSVFGDKKSLGKYLSKGKKNGDTGNGTEWHVAARNELARGGEPEPVVAALSQLLALEQALENDRADEEGKQKRKDEQRVKMNIPVPLLRFLDKNEGWNNFIRAKLRTVKLSDLHGDGVVTRFGKARKRISSWRSVRIRIPSKLVVIRLKLKMIRSVMKKKVTKQFEEGADEDSDRELCKKRILMGGRCKPLCSSGTLSYDSDGLFLPEI